MMVRIVVGAALLAAAGGTWAACADAPKLAEMKLVSPLKLAEPDSAQVVTVYRNGCVAAKFPKHDVRHGVAEMQLSPKAFDRLRAEVAASGVEGLKPELVRQALNERTTKRSRPMTLWQVSDDDIIEFSFVTDAKTGPTHVTWRALGANQLNWPDSPELTRVAALKELFSELGDEAHRHAGSGGAR